MFRMLSNVYSYMFTIDLVLQIQSTLIETAFWTGAARREARRLPVIDWLINVKFVSDAEYSRAG